MDDLKRFRYDFFGENNSQDGRQEDNDGNGMPQTQNNVILHNNSPFQAQTSTCVPEDSLMEFITDYFQGNVNDEFTDSKDCTQLAGANSHDNSSVHAFDSSINSTTSSEIFTSPDNSMMNMADYRHMNVDGSGTDGICDADLSSPGETQCPNSSRRKSISYEIVFTNSREKNGKVKIHIVPNRKTPSNQNHLLPITRIPSTETITVDTDQNLPLQQQNSWLRQRVSELERKFRCLEMESERVIGELSRIIERKNETISQLEFHIAGVRIETMKK